MTKLKFKTPLFLAASFLLIGCSSDTIVARPHGWSDTKIIENVGDKDNRMKNIYDAVKALGDTNPNVLTNVLYQIAKIHVGKFIKENESDTEITLTELKDMSSDNPEFRKFVDSHSKYKSEDFSTYIDNNGNVVKKDLNADEKYRVSLEKIKNQYNEIVENIYEKLYDEIKGGSYSTGNSKLFDEKLYYRHLKKELYINKEYAGTFKSGKAFLPKTKEQSWYQYINQYLTLGQGIYNNYVYKKILPELYKTYLIQTYVKEQRYSSLGRSYARKVNMVTVPMGNYKDKILEMMNYFAKTYITGNEIGSQEVAYDFENITKAMIGYVGTYDLTQSQEPNPQTEEGKQKFGLYKLLNYTISNTNTEIGKTTVWNKRENFSPIKVGNSLLRWKSYVKNDGSPAIDASGNPTGEITYVYYGTKLGDLVEKYLEIYDIEEDTTKTSLDDCNFTATPKAKLGTKGETAYNDITNNGSYNIVTGLAVKEKELKLNDMTKDGWFLKNGGLTDLDSTYRDRLFNISTSTTIDNSIKIKDLSKYSTGDYVRYFGQTETGKTTGGDLSKRKAFLTTATVGKENPWESIVIIGDSNFYIVEVEEASNTSKLSGAKNNDYSYFVSKSVKGEDGWINTSSNVDKLYNDIIKVNATNDTYKKNANEYYLMISNIVFYDQSVYDYFKSQFPDLFK